MLKRICVLITIIMISFTIGCNSLKAPVYQEKLWLECEADNSFRYEFLNMTRELISIFRYAHNIYSEKDAYYFIGRIDGFLANSNHEMMRVLHTKENISDEIIDQIIDPSLREPLLDFIININSYLEVLKEEIKEGQNADYFNEISLEVYNLECLMMELDAISNSSNQFTSEETVEKYLETLNKINALLEK